MLHRASHESTTVYTSLDHGNLSSYWLSLIVSCSNMVEKHQLMIFLGTMDIFLVSLFGVYVANFSVKPVPSTKSMVVAYAPVAPYYIARLRRRSLILSDKWKCNLAQSNSSIKTKPV